MVEHDLAKVGVEGSNPFARSRIFRMAKFDEGPLHQRAFRFLKTAWATRPEWRYRHVQSHQTFDHQEIEELLGKASSCQRALALFEICQFGASGDVSLGAIVTHKCEGDFLTKLSSRQRRAYQREQERCLRKYSEQDGTMYRSFEASCGAGVARNYSARFLKAVPTGRI